MNTAQHMIQEDIVCNQDTIIVRAEKNPLLFVNLNQLQQRPNLKNYFPYQCLLFFIMSLVFFISLENHEKKRNYLERVQQHFVSKIIIILIYNTRM